MMRWRPSARFDKWFMTIWFVLLSILVVPVMISRISASPDGWDWVYVLFAVVAIVGLGWMTFTAWTGRAASGAPTVPASEVEIVDVHRAVHESSNRIESIKALRTMYPGLGLGDAVHLVDNAQKL